MPRGAPTTVLANATERTRKMSAKRHLSLKVLLVHLVAATVGLAAAFGALGFATGAPAAAASHCTRYAPAISPPVSTAISRARSPAQAHIRRQALLSATRTSSY